MPFPDYIFIRLSNLDNFFFFKNCIFNTFDLLFDPCHVHNTCTYLRLCLIYRFAILLFYFISSFFPRAYWDRTVQTVLEYRCGPHDVTCQKKSVTRLFASGLSKIIEPRDNLYLVPLFFFFLQNTPYLEFLWNHFFDFYERNTSINLISVT